MEIIKIIIMVLLGAIILGFLLYNVIDLIKRIAIIVKRKKSIKEDKNNDGSCDSTSDS